MDRKQLERILARQVAPEAPVRVEVKSLGETIGLRRLTRSEEIQAAAYAYDEDPLENRARQVVATFRYAALDDDGKPLLASFGETKAFLDAISMEDFIAIGEAAEQVGPREDGDVTEGVEQAKNS